jgi:protease I
MDTLEGRRVAIVATDGVEQSELVEPREALRHASCATFLLSLKQGTIRAWQHDKWGAGFVVDGTVKDGRCDDFDALVLPGGVMNPDRLRTDPDVRAFIKDFANDGKVIAAICHGPWSLIDAGVVRGRTLTSWPSLRCDLENAGATWVDQEVCEEGNLITSRRPDDLPAFSKALIAALAKRAPVVPRQVSPV